MVIGRVRIWEIYHLNDHKRELRLAYAPAVPRAPSFSVSLAALPRCSLPERPAHGNGKGGLLLPMPLFLAHRIVSVGFYHHRAGYPKKEVHAILALGGIMSVTTDCPAPWY